MPMTLYKGKSAIVSRDKKYRYELIREWDMPGSKPPKTVTFIMLNPSTADAAKDDPTIRRCVSFARRNGGARLIVANLFAFRSSSPEELKRIHYQTDIIGPEYWERLDKTLELTGRDGLIIAGWGVHGRLIAQDAAVCHYLKEAGRALYCLGTTASGAPKHPLYLSKNTKLRKYVMEGL